MLLAASSDAKSARRLAAVRALAALGRPRAVRLLESALKDKDETVREQAAASLAEMGARRSVRGLRQSLKGDTPAVRFAAAKALWRLGDHCGRSVLVDVLAGESSLSGSFFKQNLENADKKLHDPRTLALTGINEASGALLGPFSLGVTVAEQFTKDKSAPARAISASLLASDHDPSSIRELRSALSDKNWLVRMAAAKALARHPCRQVFPNCKCFCRIERKRSAIWRRHQC
jgi:HEAT repeat protein